MDVSCPLCDGKTWRPLLRTNFNLTGRVPQSYKVVECRNCGFRYLNPRPSPDELSLFYENEYPAYTPYAEGSGLTAEEKNLNRRFQQVALLRQKLLSRFLPQPWARRRVLDVGCGNGAFLVELSRRQNVETWGLDISAFTLANLAKHNSSLRLIHGNLHSAPLPEDYFDVITLWHVLEHDGDPVGLLRRARQLLRPDGLLLVEVPNSDGLIARWCGSNWLGWDLPRHLVHFSPATLRRSAVQAGLQVTQVQRQYTLNPVCLSPLLASLAIWNRRRRGNRKMKRANYRQWQGAAGIVLRLVNSLERFLGSNGLLLVARPPKESISCTTSGA